MAQENVIDLFNRDGTQSKYRLFSARLPEFMKAYPAEDGWCVEREAVSAVSLQPELVQMHVAAISVGKSPKDLGLPALPAGMLFKCQLVDPNGKVVRTASSLVVVREFDGQPPPVGGWKDWEAGETNAFQRLAAAMGFGGDQLDSDEKQIQGRSEKVVAGNTAAAAPVAVIEVEDESRQVSVTDDPASSEGGAPAKAVKAVKAVKTSKPGEEALFGGFKRQVEMLARQLKIDVPDVKTVQDCKDAMATMVPPASNPKA